MAIGSRLALHASEEIPFRLAPAVALEAEFFSVERGWRVIQNGHGNYMVDAIGFQHIGGERLLGIDEVDATAAAHADVEVPEAGDYRLWVRYEYPPMTEARFRVEVWQDTARRCQRDGCQRQQSLRLHGSGNATPGSTTRPEDRRGSWKRSWTCRACGREQRASS